MESFEEYLRNLSDNNDNDNDSPSPEEQAIAEAIIKLIDEMVVENAERFKVDTYWRYVRDENQGTVFFRVVGVSGGELTLRAVRDRNNGYGRHVSFEPASVVSPIQLIGCKPISKAEYDEVMNQALLLVDEICRSERYHQEDQ